MTFGPFDHIILGTPAPISSSLLKSLPAAHPGLCKALSVFNYVPSLVVTHNDSSYVPASPVLHRDLHFQRPCNPSKGLRNLKDYTQVTHILHYRNPHLQSVKLYQTTNPHRYPQEDTVLSQTWFERYLPTLESIHTRKEVFAKGGWGQGYGNIWFVGSWVGEGIPLLEGCIESAEIVVDSIFSKK